MTPNPLSDKHRVIEIVRIAMEGRGRARASARVGYTVMERISWLLDFVQKDISRASDGDLLNINEELQAYGSPVKSGFYATDTSPRTLSRPKIGTLQKKLKDYLSNALEGGDGLNIKITIGMLGAKNPKTGQFDAARYGDPYHLVRLQVIEDLQDIELGRIRRCQRGVPQDQDSINIDTCGKLFFAKDLRQRFCSKECAQVVRWKKYWNKHGEIINKKRRKTDRRRKPTKAK